MNTLSYPVTRKTLSSYYRITPTTLTVWLTDIGIKHKRTLSPKDLKQFVAEYGAPENIIVKL